MRSVLFLALLLASACAEKTVSSLKLGQTTRSDLVALKGEAISEKAIPVPDSSMLIYKDNEKFQLKGDVVINRFSDPVKEERELIWWKHKFKDCQTTEKKLEQNSPTHTPPEIEYACPAEGISIIYTDGSDTVSRVVEYEKK